MPYTKDDPKLPSYIKNKSESIRIKWVKVFNKVLASEGKEMAMIVANQFLKKAVKESSIIARNTSNIKKLTFEIQPEMFLQRTESGEEYVTAILANDEEHHDGKRFSESVLVNWQNQINSGEVVIGDFEHEYMQDILKKPYSPDTIKTLIKNKPGIAKTVQAIYEKGKLFVKLLIDKRYRNKIMNSKGLSAECYYDSSKGDNINSAELLGFTFGINENTSLPGTSVLA